MTTISNLASVLMLNNINYNLKTGFIEFKIYKQENVRIIETHMSDNNIKFFKSVRHFFWFNYNYYFVLEKIK